MRRSKVELDAVALFDLLIAVEFTPVVSRDRAKLVRVPCDKLPQPPVCLMDRPGGEFADEDVSGFPVHDRQDAGLILTHDRVDFPVPDPRAVLRTIRALSERPLAGEPAAAVVGPVSFPPLLPSPASKPFEEVPAALLVAE